MRPGEDTVLKARLVALSGEAARVLGPGAMRPCADARVRQAVAAALAAPTLSERSRRELASLAAQIATDADDDATRDVTLRFRVTADEAEQIRASAEMAGQSLSDYVRRACLET